MKLDNETLGRKPMNKIITHPPHFTTTSNLFQKGKYISFLGDEKKKKASLSEQTIISFLQSSESEWG